MAEGVKNTTTHDTNSSPLGFLGSSVPQAFHRFIVSLLLFLLPLMFGRAKKAAASAASAAASTADAATTAAVDQILSDVESFRGLLTSNGYTIDTVTLTAGLSPSVAVGIVKGPSANPKKLVEDSAAASLPVKAGCKAVATASGLDSTFQKHNMSTSKFVVVITPTVISSSVDIELTFNQ